MKKFHVYAVVTGSKYLGEVDAETKEEAIEKGENLKSVNISICHQCSSECENPEVTEITAEEA